MEIITINNISELRKKLAELKKEKISALDADKQSEITSGENTNIYNNSNDITVGFVPTMGGLHAGHQSLIEKSKSENAITVVSIFLNPMQFSAGEDLDTYPSTIETDKEKCLSSGADIIFYPSNDDIYPKGFSTFIDMTSMTSVMCGKSRPNHFRGVFTVVAKLFNIVQPDRAYFGQKDAQQLAVIKRMVIDLNIPIEIVGCPTVREEDGLAMSTRNSYLNGEERVAAKCLYMAIKHAEKEISNCFSNTSKYEDTQACLEKTLTDMTEIINKEPLTEIDYIELLDADTFCEISEETNSIICAIAVNIGETRLIDNVTIHR